MLIAMRLAINRRVAGIPYDFSDRTTIEVKIIGDVALVRQNGRSQLTPVISGLIYVFSPAVMCGDANESLGNGLLNWTAR